MHNDKHKHEWHYATLYLLPSYPGKGRGIPVSKECKCGKVFEYKAGKDYKKNQFRTGIVVKQGEKMTITYS